MVINDGTTIRGLVGVQICGGNVTINGGNIQSTDTTEREAPYKDANEGDGNILDGSAVSIVSRTAYGDANVTINGGTFSAYESNDAVKQYGYKKGDGGYEVIPNPTKVEVEIFAGEFSSDVSNYVVDGAKWDENTGTIVPDVTGDTVATVGNIAYDNLKDAIDNAEPGDTVLLLKDTTVTSTGSSANNDPAVKIDKAITLDGNGHKIQVTSDFTTNNSIVSVDYVDGTVVIKDLTIEGGSFDHVRNCLNIIDSNNVTLENLKTSGGTAGVVVNGAKVIIQGTETDIQNGRWGYAVNVDSRNSANSADAALTVKSGTVGSIWAENSDDTTETITVVINGGNIGSVGVNSSAATNVTATVYGGTFDSDPTPYLAPGLSWNPSNGAVYDPSQNRPSSGSSSSEPSYSPKLDVSDGGSIKINPRTPEEDDEVTITVDPDSGYEVDEVTVTDRNGREVKVTAERDGTYTFIQPRGRVTISVTFVREGGSTFFSDVPESFWAYDEIAWAYDNGYVNGTSASSFSPNASISRQQVWMILARLSGADPANMSAAREWAVTNGVSDGTTPGGAVTRQQLVALLYRYATLMGYANDQRADLSAYPDAGTVAGYAVEPMQWSVANSIVGGTSNGTLDPTGTATRAQFAVILYRFWDQVG